MPPGGKGTRTGAVQEKMVEAVLNANGYLFQKQVIVNHQLFGNRYVADFLIDGKIIVSLKWQQVSGTAEQKVIYEIATLINIVTGSHNKISRAYLVFGGNGFSDGAVKYLQSQRHRLIFRGGDLVTNEKLEDFIARTNNKKL